MTCIVSTDGREGVIIGAVSDRFREQDRERSRDAGCDARAVGPLACSTLPERMARTPPLRR
jgi:hypothetical protein